VCGQWEGQLTDTCPGPKDEPAREAQLGFDATPARYNDNPDGRETIDRMFDELIATDLRVMWGDDADCYAMTPHQEAARKAGLCAALALKYEDRAGKKGDPEGDKQKARFYRQMQKRWEQNDESLDPRTYRVKL
jgi:hypothetical protein